MASERPMEDVARYIHSEMMHNLNSSRVMMVKMANDNTYKEIGKIIDHPPSTGLVDNAIDFSRNFYRTGVVIGSQAAAYALFFDLVKPDGVMDHKSAIRQQFGLYSFDYDYGRKYYFDVWSNIHYGYIGIWCGFSSLSLKSGAGFGQVLASTNGKNVIPDGYFGRLHSPKDLLIAFDDPWDQVAIQLGMDFWVRYGAGLTLKDLLNTIRENARSLNTATIPIATPGSKTIKSKR